MGQSLAEALSAAKMICHEDARTVALGGFATDLDSLTERLTAVKAIREEFGRGRALSSIARHLKDSQPTETLTAVKTLGDEVQAHALKYIAAHLTSDLLPEALAAARAIGDGRSRAEALSGLVKHLSATQQKEAFVAFLSVARTPASVKSDLGCSARLGIVGGND
jgi:hypothetical protein